MPTFFWDGIGLAVVRCHWSTPASSVSYRPDLPVFESRRRTGRDLLRSVFAELNRTTGDIHPREEEAPGLTSQRRVETIPREGSHSRKCGLRFVQIGRVHRLGRRTSGSEGRAARPR